MKIQCSGCEAEEARVFCCADEAALCYGCDEKIHVANKLVSKHQRVTLSASPSPMPKCDICQETFGYFLCLDDRALLCRKCDVGIHTINSSVSRHQRFLLPGVKVGMETTGLGKSTKRVASHLHMSKTSRDTLAALTQVVTSSKDGEVVEKWSNGVSTNEVVACGNDTTTCSQSREFAGLIDSNQNNPSGQDVLHKADDKVHGSSEWWKILRSAEEQLLNDEWGAADDVSWTVPKLLHPYSLTDYCSPTETTNLSGNTAFKISDAGWPSAVDSQYHQNSLSTMRRSRQRRKS